MNYILDEIVMAGMVLETNADLILEAIKDRLQDASDAPALSVFFFTVPTVFGWMSPGTLVQFCTL